MRKEKFQFLKYNIHMCTFLVSVLFFFLQSLQGQMQEIVEEKTHINNEYQKLNATYQQNLKEQNDLLVLCSTYEDQLSKCRNLIKSAGLTVN